MTNLDPVFGFNHQLAVACSRAPQAATCGVQPATATLDGTNPAAVTITVTTTPRSMLDPILENPNGASPRSLHGNGAKRLLVMLLGALMVEAGRQLRTRRLWSLLPLLLPVLPWSSCNAGPMIHGTPPGDFVLTITGASTVNHATLSHTGNLGLTVN